MVDSILSGLENFMVDPEIELLSEFRPISLVEHSIRRHLAESRTGIELEFAVERENSQIKRHSMQIVSPGEKFEDSNLERVATAIKTALWMYGGHTVSIDGPTNLILPIQNLFLKGNRFGFDAEFMQRIYGKELTINHVSPGNLPVEHEQLFNLGKDLVGRVIAFDIGASDIKVAAYDNGKLVYSHELPWNPIVQNDPAFFREVMTGLIRNAAGYLSGPLQGIGGSAAGVIVDNTVKVASWLRGTDKAGKLTEAGNLFNYLSNHFQVPIRVLNDGPVAAKAGQFYLEGLSSGQTIGGIAGLALGSSVAAGSIDTKGNVTSRLEEGAFIPLGYPHIGAPLLDSNRIIPQDEWSGQYAFAAGFLSQMAVDFLIPRARFTDSEIAPNLLVPDKLIAVQDYLRKGDERAHKLLATIGQSCGYAVPTYLDYCSPGITHFVIFGRVASKGAQEIISGEANKILQTRFPYISERVQVVVPKDDETVRKGQAAAAARLVSFN